MLQSLLRRILNAQNHTIFEPANEMTLTHTNDARKLHAPGLLRFTHTVRRHQTELYGMTRYFTTAFSLVYASRIRAVNSFSVRRPAY